MATTNDSPMMRQYRDLKSKHPDAVLLFRCGDFYETYEDDAKECAKVLGITLTKRHSDGVAMAGFPHHALDTYLPKLIRTGHRIAICDQLDPPTGPKRKRGESIDKAAIKREQSDACIDSAEREQAQTKFNNSNNNQNNSEDEVMTNETMKVADLIGKSIGNGGNAKYTINAIEGDKVSVTFQMGDSEGKPMTMGVAQVEKLLQGGWTVQGSEECRVKSEECRVKSEEGSARRPEGESQFATAQEEPTEKKADGGSQKAEEPKAKTVKMTSEREQSGTRSGSAERESSRPQGKMEPEPKPKQEQPAKPKVTNKKSEGRGKKEEVPQPSAIKHQTSYVYSTYTNAKGKTCAKISGFAETDAAYQKEASASLHGSATYENTKQGRVNFLLFGPRYAEVAKTVCQMLNEGKTVADCQAVVDAATEERMAKREERKQKREAYRQEREGRSYQPSDINHQTSSGKTYTEAEMLDLMERVMRGDADALAEVNAIKAKAA